MRQSLPLLVIFPALCCFFCAPIARAQAPAPTRPRVAVAPFVNQAGHSLDAWWAGGGQTAVLTSFSNQLNQSNKVVVIDNKDLQALVVTAKVNLNEPITRKIAQALGQADHSLKYLVVGAITDYTLGAPSDGNVSTLTAMNATMFNLSTGEVSWTDEANHRGLASVTGPAAGSIPFYDKFFDKLVKPVIAELIKDVEMMDL